MKLGLNQLSSYIAKIFLIRFLLVCLGFGLLFFLINFIENTEKFRDSEGMTAVALLMALLHSPHFLNGVVSSIALLSGILTTHRLASRSELVIIRSCGLSIWFIVKPIMLTSAILGILWITVFDPISIISDKYFFTLDKKFVKKELRDAIEPISGIWLRQENQEQFVGEFRQFFKESTAKNFPRKSANFDKKTLTHRASSSVVEEETFITTAAEDNMGNILIYGKKIYPNSLRFGDISFWFFDKKQDFYKKIDGEYGELKDGWWQVEGAIINDNHNINFRQNKIKISSNLSEEFVHQKIQNDLKMPELYNIFDLPKLAKEMSDSGLSNVKFEIRYHSLLALPIILIAMSVMGAFFGINHMRSGKANFRIFSGIVCGLMFYILISIINALGSSELLSLFAATWVISFLTLASSLLLIATKDRV